MDRKIILKEVNVNNLKGVSLELNHGELIVFTGVSGSGKSSLAFETIYREGQRRYIESLSHHARRYLGDQKKPDAKEISGLAPTIAIEQKTQGKSPRSTVGTMTGIYDFLRVLFSKLATARCPISKESLKPQSRDQIIFEVKKNLEKSKLIILAPFAKQKKGEFKEEFKQLQAKGFTKVRVDGNIVELSEEIPLDKNLYHDIDIVVDRLIFTQDDSHRLTESISSALETGEGVCKVLNLSTNEERLFSEYAYSEKSGQSYPPLDSQDFSFNHPKGMCEECHGLQTSFSFDEGKIADPDLSISEGTLKIGGSFQTVRYGNIYKNLARIYDFSLKTPWKKLSKKAKEVILYGTKEKWTKMRFVHPEKHQRWTEFVHWQGVIHEGKKRLMEAKSDAYKKKMQEMMTETICPKCQGSRLKPYPSAAIFHGKTLMDLTQCSLKDMHDFFMDLSLVGDEKIIGQELIKEIISRSSFLIEVGLYYLNLDRSSTTLSGGEAQRVRLAAEIGTGLEGAIYVLDEPSIGLHYADHTKLIETLKKLQNKGNTVVVVEHDEKTMLAADTIVDVGPLAGKNGGEILAIGSVDKICQSPRSLTGQYLSKKLSIAIPESRRKLDANGIVIKGAKHHNLKNIDVTIPLGGLICITGASGSGKSSLIEDILYPYLANQLQNAKLSIGSYKQISLPDKVKKVISIDQSPIGRTPRSNPATFIKVFDEIRKLFTQTPQSKAKGFTAGFFSFNVKEGSCFTCQGMGSVRIELDFLEDEWTTCPQCEGKRFDPEVLEVKYKGKNIADILDMDVDTALQFFASIPLIQKKLQLLQDIGLGYIALGQPSTTISGGEAQRIKLAKELSRPDKGHTIYLLDEPTTGLHTHDLSKLLGIVDQLIEAENSVIVIEHNLDFLKRADWIIDLGPYGGKGGGEITGYGTPEAISQLPTLTGAALQTVFQDESEEISSIQSAQKVGEKTITVEEAHQNNLKHISLSLPKQKMIFCTGPSGSGKTSFAIDTIYAEGQRRYIESLSLYARNMFKQSPKPLFKKIEGLSPAIAIEQSTHAVNPRSTVGTLTEIYDFCRILYAHLGKAYDPKTKEPIASITKEYVIERLSQLPDGTKMQILAPIPIKESFDNLIERLKREGFIRIRVNGSYYEIDETIPFDKKRKNQLALVIDRLVKKAKDHSRLSEAIEKASYYGKRELIAALPDKDLYFHLDFTAVESGKSYPPLSPKTFSFNAKEGMCLECGGIGTVYGMNIQQSPSFLRKSIKEHLSYLGKDLLTRAMLSLLLDYFKQEKIDSTKPLKDLPPSGLHFFLFGGKAFSTDKKMHLRWRGLQTILSHAVKSAHTEIRQALLPYMEKYPCPECQGERLNPLARNVKLSGLTIGEFCHLPIKKALPFIESIQEEILAKPYLKEVFEGIQKHLSFLIEIGLSYLSLDRTIPTLSGGELQRIRLSRQLGVGLVHCIYVLDEPTSGLHPSECDLLKKVLLQLKELGNTIILVEHDLDLLQIADQIIDFGPVGGHFGGYVTFQGSYQQIRKDPNSLTGAYLSGKEKIPIPSSRRALSFNLHVTNASLHNLKSIDLSFPVGAWSCITGVSGSGKSSLLHGILALAATKMTRRRYPKKIVLDYAEVEGFNQFDKVVILDQHLPSLSMRSDVCSYSDTLKHLRSFYASLKEAKSRGLKPVHFSYHHIRGMCKTCWGLGIKNIDLQYLPPVTITCPSCRGYRLNPLSLQVTYKGKHLGLALKMTVSEAKEFFEAITPIRRRLDYLEKVGLGYVQLGQHLSTLSGGETQRLRLMLELSKRARGSILYLFDEPTKGLHSDDIAHLLPICHELVDKKHTLITIEHHLDMIANADYIIDIGPKAADEGGRVVGKGSPEDISLLATATGKALASFFSGK
jgi:excinuclease ABC subunit A